MSLLDRLEALEREAMASHVEQDYAPQYTWQDGQLTDATLPALRRLLDVVRAAEAHRRVGKDVYAGAVWIDCPSECYTATRRRCTLVAALDALNTETPPFPPIDLGPGAWLCSACGTTTAATEPHRCALNTETPP